MQNHRRVINAVAVQVMTLIVMLAAHCTVRAQEVELGLDLDVTPQLTEPDSISPISHNWLTLLKQRRLDINDTTVRYPRFIQFCINVYRWAEKNFNTYDPEYVSGTGKHGKVRLVTDNWTDSYYVRFSEGLPLIMVSNPYSNIGIQANYSALSAGYSIDLNSVISGKKSEHHKWNFSVSCARLYLDAFLWQNYGSTDIRRFGNDEVGRIDHVRFDGLKFRAFGAMGMYIFNYRRFSLPAGYNLSNYQLRSQGSWMAGLSGSFYDCSFDFSKLPPEIAGTIDASNLYYRFDYNSLNLMGGYSYNWVINRHFLFNTTTLPGLGMAFTFSNATESDHVEFSAILRQMLALTYTQRQFFIALNGTLHGNFYLSKNVGFMAGIGNLQVSTGVRF